MANGGAKNSRVAVFLNRGIITAAGMAVAAAICLANGCFVHERCFGDADCAAPKICRDGGCLLECREDTDCVKELICVDHRCRSSEECETCSYPNAEVDCTHGVCSMGPCHDGWIDLNGSDEDGCEYECTFSNGKIEACDGLDNDCDGQTDEDFDLARDPLNCGACGDICPERPHARPLCESRTCTFACDNGWHDNNKLPEDGCESAECIPAQEVCDGADNDCDCPGDTNDDGVICGPGDENVDEGFDKTDPETCGDYCIECRFDNADPLCVDGACALGACDDGWHDTNKDPGDGCECPETNGGVEKCDGVDNDCDGQTDEGGVCGFSCPSDMVKIGSGLCIDIYEASRKDATATSEGTDNSIATSRAGVLPWTVNPMTYDHYTKFVAACQAAGKELCSADDWYAACTGPSSPTTYVYGDDFDPEVCNCVDTFCDDHCEDQGIPRESCNTGANCGYDYSCFKKVPAGQFLSCTNGYGTFDMSGNAWEIVRSKTDARGYEVRGGAFNCASARSRLTCSYNAGWQALYAGFRCCLRQRQSN